jgi:hypothetical protein
VVADSDPNDRPLQWQLDLFVLRMTPLWLINESTINLTSLSGLPSLPS